MATKFVKQATKQLAPVYAQSEKAISSQVPAIQNLYNTLIQGLQTSYDTQLQSGVQGITEDASARGVLRSTLPVDARQALTTQLGQALLQGQGELGAKQAGDIAAVNKDLGSLRIQKSGAIADLARALETGDLDKQRFALEKLNSERDYQLKRASLAKSSSGGGDVPQWQLKQGAIEYVASKWKPGADDYVNPAQWNSLRKEWINSGFNPQDFDNQFSDLINPAHFSNTGLPQYKVGAATKKLFG